MIKLFNDNFNKGVTMFQICLMFSLILFGYLDNQTGIFFSTFMVLFGYLEPNQPRFYLEFKGAESK